MNIRRLFLFTCAWLSIACAPFNAVAQGRPDAAARHSHAQGHVGDFALTPTPEGFNWTIPVGPNMTIRYTTTIKDGTWYEVGDRLVPGKEPARFFEMTLKRIGNTDWPAAGSVAPKK